MAFLKRKRESPLAEAQLETQPKRARRRVAAAPCPPKPEHRAGPSSLAKPKKAAKAKGKKLKEEVTGEAGGASLRGRGHLCR
jgi:hypothetical protein